MEGWRKEFDLELEASFKKWLQKASQPKPPRLTPLAEHNRNMTRKKAAARRKQKQKVYLAGRIEANDWRAALVSDLRGNGNAGDLEGWRAIKTLPMQDGNIYVGPFFIACDHCCYHGVNQHGAGATVDGNGCMDKPTPEEVFNKALEGIRACDLFFAWADPTFSQAYGTLVEIGIAKGLGKRVVIAYNDLEVDYSNQWFAFEAAESISSPDPVLAYEQLMGVSVAR